MHRFETDRTPESGDCECAGIDRLAIAEQVVLVRNPPDRRVARTGGMRATHQGLRVGNASFEPVLADANVELRACEPEGPGGFGFVEARFLQRLLDQRALH